MARLEDALEQIYTLQMPTSNVIAHVATGFMEAKRLAKEALAASQGKDTPNG